MNCHSESLLDEWKRLAAIENERARETWWREVASYWRERHPTVEQLTPQQSEIMRILEDCKSASTTEIAEKVGICTDSLRGRMETLCNKGFVRRAGKHVDGLRRVTIWEAV